MLGVIYQFYYDGGDTFNYFTHGSKWIWEAFWDEPALGISLLASSGGERTIETFLYSQHIWYYRDPNSYFIVRLTAFFDLITFHTYSATALFFASFSFSGLWALFSAISKKYPHRIKWLAISVLFFPSLIFWGSGILKDTVTIGALAWLTWSLIHIIEFNRRNWVYWVTGVVAIWVILLVKLYILICFLPMVFVWMYWKRILAIKSLVARILVAPVLLALFATMGLLSLIQVTEESKKYSLDSIAERAAITAYDIRYGWGARTQGEGGYSLGQLDGSWQSMIRLMPQAINVTLFRPYLWEVRNPLMLLSALESLVILALTVWFLVYKKGLMDVLRDPFLLFCFLFALLFAFAVGVSTYNFGTLMRYKIPLIPFFLIVVLSKKTNA